MATNTSINPFIPRGATEDIEPTTNSRPAPKLSDTYAAHHTFDGIHQLRRVQVTEDEIKQGEAPILAFCRRLTRLFDTPAVASFKEEAVSKDGRQHLYRVVVAKKRPTNVNGRPVLAEGWMRIVRDERQTRRH